MCKSCGYRACTDCMRNFEHKQGLTGINRRCPMCRKYAGWHDIYCEMKIKVTNSHFKLLYYLPFKFKATAECYGAITSDPDQPFGNTGIINIHEDMARILEGEPIEAAFDILFTELAPLVQLLCAQKMNFDKVRPGYTYELKYNPEEGFQAWECDPYEEFSR